MKCESTKLESHCNDCLSCRTQAATAGAVTMLRFLPEKLNPVIKPLMESIKKEEDEQLQVC